MLMNKHIHLSEAEIRRYVYADHQLTANERDHIELEIQICEYCAEKYANFTLTLSQTPMVASDEKWSQLIERVEQERKLIDCESVNKRKWYEHNVVQVALAASITGVLFVSGLLSIFTSQLDSVEKERLVPYKLETEVKQEHVRTNINVKIELVDFFESMKLFIKKESGE